MKKYFPNLLPSRELRLAILVAIVAALGIAACSYGKWTLGPALIAAAIAMVAAFWYLVVRPARVPGDAVVMIRLAGPLNEDAHLSPLQSLIRPSALTLYHLRYALEAAASDPGVRAVVVEIAGLEAGMATALELNRLLGAIRAAGKRVVAILTGDTTGVRDYLVAAGAGEIVANPDTMFTMLGVAAGNVFLKSALDKLNIQVQTLQWKEYKGAAEMVNRDAMSPEMRESLGAIVADWQTIVVDAIAAGRKLDRARAEELAGAGFLTTRAAVEARLIDRDGYIEDIRAELDPDGKHKCFVGIGRYFRHAMYRRERGRRARIALIHGVGPVIAGEAPPTGEYISGQTTSAQFERASRDEQVRAIVFRVNSPGGSAVGSDLVWRAVREAQSRGKPVVVSMGDVAGSGGYYVAMGADSIVAEPATITGSIGVVYAKPNFGNLMHQLGVRFEYAKSAETADALSMARAMSEAELTQLNQAVGHTYANFTAKVAEGRKLSAEQTEAVARGRVWSGIAAKERGLIDELGGLQKAVEVARRLAFMQPQEVHQLVRYAPERRLLSLRLAGMMGESMPWAVGVAARAIGMPVRWAPAMIQLLARGGVMLLCPFLEL